MECDTLLPMPRQTNQQLNIRSAFARTRVREIAERTGMTATEIVEDALRGYVPPGVPARADGLVWKGPVLVKPAAPGARVLTLEEVNATIDAIREERSDEIINPPS